MNSKLEHRNIQVTLPSDGPSADFESIVANMSIHSVSAAKSYSLGLPSILKRPTTFFVVDCIRRSQEQNSVLDIFNLD